MRTYFDKSNKEWLTMERVFIDSVNECLRKQRSSTINVKKDLESKQFTDYLRNIMTTIRDAGIQSAFMKMRRTNNEKFSAAQKRLLFELCSFGKKHWAELTDLDYERTTVRSGMLKTIISKNTELQIHLRAVGKLPARDLLEKLDSSTLFTEFSNSLYLACKTPPNHSWDSQKLLPASARQSTRPLLVLDIDETLLHTFLERPKRFDFHTEIEYKVPCTRSGAMRERLMSQKVYINKRPHLEKFLRVLSTFFDIITWTASIQSYADIVLDRIDPSHQYIKHRLYRKHCTTNPGNQYIKDLSRLGKPMNKLVIVDNSCLAFSFHLGYGIPIFPFIDDRHDTELLHLLPILIKLSTSEDISADLSTMYHLETIKKGINAK